MSIQRLRARLEDERGVVAVIVAILMVVLVGSAALTFDLARLRHERHMIQAAVDLGSLAGADLLPVSDPVSASLAELTARQIAVKNSPVLASSGLTINFACVVSDPEMDGGQNSLDLTFACGPAGGIGSWSGGWTSRSGKSIHDCNPYAGDLCNTIRLTASSTIDYFFAPIMGFNRGSTGAVRAAACRGFCGQASSLLDVVFVIDRTGSMSAADIANLKDAIADPSPAEDSVLEFYDPTDVYIGLVALPYKNQSNCNVGVASPQLYPAPSPPSQSLWQVVPLSNDYRLTSGNLNPGSTLVTRVQCLQRAGSPVVRVGGIDRTSAGHTNHGDPLQAAQWMLENDPRARTDAPNVIVFFADGESNQPAVATQPCGYADAATDVAKARDTLVFSLGYGAVGARCQRDTAGQFANAWATTFLSQVASPIPSGAASTDDVPGGCGVNENADGDFYFCESRGEDLESVFRQIAIQSIQRSRLLNF